MESSDLVPASEEFSRLLSAFVLDKALYELDVRAEQPARLDPDPAGRAF